ncbi:MAG: prolipoprotein diacylglyceryl transferase [Clostridia bacterium]|nr:prolipoprotein diacylglyceryl transferase [Clostridia bacterium]
MYGLLIACAIGLAVALCEKECRRKGLKKDSGIDMALWAVPFAIVGARLYYVAFRWDYFRHDLTAVLRIWEGGLAIYGAVIGGFVGLFWMSRRQKITFSVLLDIAAPLVLLGQCIGRWGNYFNGEAYGYAVQNAALQFFPVSVYVDGQWHLATFFYESCWNALGFVLLWTNRKKTKKNGDTALSYLLWYGAGRLFIEGLRTDSLMLLSMRVSQLLSLSLCVTAVLMQAVRYKKKKGLWAGCAVAALAVICLATGQTYLTAVPALAFAALYFDIQKARL